MKHTSCTGSFCGADWCSNSPMNHKYIYVIVNKILASKWHMYKPIYIVIIPRRVTRKHSKVKSIFPGNIQRDVIQITTNDCSSRKRFAGSWIMGNPADGAFREKGEEFALTFRLPPVSSFPGVVHVCVPRNTFSWYFVFAYSGPRNR